MRQRGEDERAAFSQLVGEIRRQRASQEGRAVRVHPAQVIGAPGQVDRLHHPTRDLVGRSDPGVPVAQRLDLEGGHMRGVHLVPSERTIIDDATDPHTTAGLPRCTVCEP